MISKIKKALNTRFYFDNWFASLVGYVLNRVGFNVKLKAKINNCVFEIDPEVFARFVSRASRGLIKSTRCYDNNLLINDVQVNNIADVIYNIETWAKVFGWIYDKSCGCWVKDGVKFRQWHDSILEVFDYGHWDRLNVEDKVVVDVGAFIGDSSIYFALRGASRVIAVEPHPEAYKVMVENIRLNSLEDVITPINAGLSSRPGVICIKNVDVEGTYGTYHGLGECDTAVPAITLADLIDKYNVSRDAILKMDCEGCEYDVILNDYEHVKLFNEIAFEYHEGAIGKLLKVLVRDYNCSHVARYRVVYCTRKRV